MPDRHPIPIVVLLLLAVMVSWLRVEPARGCPACKLAVPNGQSAQEASAADEATGSLAATAGRGYNYSILFMMAAPFALAGSLGGMLWFAIRQSGRGRMTPRGRAGGHP